MNVSFSCTVSAETDMLALGAKLAAVCRGGELITLQGDLGAGKTTLVRGFLHKLGHSGKVKSPTYTIVESYLHTLPVHHFDLYRLSGEEELEMIGFRDYMQEPGICLIEWPERCPALLSEASVRIEIEYLQTGRHVTVVTAKDYLMIHS